MPHYKNSGLRLSFSTIMSMWVHKFFKWMISSIYLAIAWLVVLVRKDRGTISPFSCLVDLHLVLTARFKKGAYKEGNLSHRDMPNKFVINFKASLNCVFIVFFSFFTVVFPACQSYSWRPCHFVHMMTLYNRRKFCFGCFWKKKQAPFLE